MASKVILIVALSIVAGAGLATKSARSGPSQDVELSSSENRTTGSAEDRAVAYASEGVLNTERGNPAMNHLTRSTPVAVASPAPDGARSPDASQRTTTGGFDPAPVVSFAAQPPAHLIVDSPLPAQLNKGYVVIRYRAENLRILPVFGPEALGVTPRIGHLHITVDDAPWHWLDASGEPISINGLLPGPHKVLIELEDPTHKVIDSVIVRFDIPGRPVP